MWTDTQSFAVNGCSLVVCVKGIIITMIEKNVYLYEHIFIYKYVYIENFTYRTAIIYIKFAIFFNTQDVLEF